jgi:fucose 4-O-acetylase-like acetyltransferase
MPEQLTSAPPAARLDAIDRIKACAILAVIITHAGKAPIEFQFDRLDWWLRLSWTSFHVPAFLITAGFLARSKVIRYVDVVRQIRRILVPYLVVMSFNYALGLAPWPGWLEVWPHLAVSYDFGLYYYVPVYCLTLNIAWAISKLGRPALFAALGIAAWYLVLVTVAPAAILSTHIYARICDPLLQFWLGYMLIGWLDIPQRLAPIAPTWVWYVIAGSLIPIWALDTSGPVRVVYTVAVVTALWQSNWTFPLMRELSESSLALYLIHRPIQLTLLSTAAPWPIPVRILFEVVVSLGGAMAICRISRRVLGQSNARAWLGA